MKFYLEVTKWPDKTLNGTYLLDDSKSKMYAFVRHGTTEVKTFKKPITIDVRGRKFVEVKNTFGYKIKQGTTSNPQWKVRGSKGDIYTVEQTDNGLTCTCSGFKFRGNCKHLKEISQ